MTASRVRLTALLPVLVLVCGSLIIQAQSAAPRPIALDDYAQFKRITGAAISNDGKWMHYTVTPNDGDATLYVRSLETEKVQEIPRGANPAFSEDGRWIGYFIAPHGGVVEYTAEVGEVGEDYKVGGPEDWKWPPGRTDHWGVSKKDTARICAAERTFRFRA